MDRSSFLRSLFIVAAAPKMLAKINLTPKTPPINTLFKDLNFVIPDYYNKMVAKYGDTNFFLVMESLDNSVTNNKSFFHFEKQKT